MKNRKQTKQGKVHDIIFSSVCRSKLLPLTAVVFCMLLLTSCAQLGVENVNGGRVPDVPVKLTWIEEDGSASYSEEGTTDENGEVTIILSDKVGEVERNGTAIVEIPEGTYGGTAYESFYGSEECSSKLNDRRTIYLEPKTPSIISVAAEPGEITLERGSTQQFSASVAAVNADSSVTWSVDSSNSEISEEGLLTVGTEETAQTLIVTATSTFDSSQFGTAVVTVLYPAVTGVTVTPESAEMERGSTQKFSADVTAEDGASSEVIWSVDSNKSEISEDGTLTVGAEETAQTLTVTAASVFDNTQTGTASVTVVQHPAVTGVIVTPESAEMEKGSTQKFSADVTAVDGASTQVIWSVDSNKSEISEDGTLTVGAEETAQTLTVTAASVFDNTQTGTASVTVVLHPAVTGVTVTPESAEMERGSTQKFNANVTAVDGASTEVVWSVDSNKSEIREDGTLTVGAEETAQTLTVTAASVFDNTQSGTASVTVVQHPAVTGVTVTPESAEMERGSTQKFNADVTAVDGASTEVIWSVDSNKSEISEDGTLTVGEEETAQTLTVTAASVVDNSQTSTASVTVLYPAVTGVAVTPGAAELEKGSTQKFSADVTAINGALSDVIWSVDSTISSIDSEGILTVSKNETAKTLIVTATSVFDNTQKASSTVMVIPIHKETSDSTDKEIVPSTSPTPQTPSTPQTSALNELGSTPKTGDSSNLSLWIILVITAGAVIYFIIRYRKYRSR